MIRYFDKFIIKKIEEPFDKDNIKTDSTVLISFYNKENKEVEETKFGYISLDKIFKSIDSNEKICLDNCFIENFSLEEYRQSRKLSNDFLVKFIDFSANNSFFYCTDKEKNIDFSNAEFNSDSVGFHNTYFNSGKTVLFDNSIFNCDIYFDYALFKDLDISFNNASFNKNIVSFKNTIFTTGFKKFENINFNNSDVSFLNVEFGDGDLIFANSVFNSGKISFKVSRIGKGRVDFVRVNFGKGDVIFEKVDFGQGDVNFRAAVFGNGKVDFTRCEFDDGDVSFNDVDFGDGDLSFAGTDFGNGKVSFKLALFGIGKLDFHFSKFGIGDIIFERTIFKDGNIDFRAVDFGEGRITFNKAVFGNGEVTFEASELANGRISFRRTIFGSGIFNFEMARFQNAELIIDDVNFGQGKVSFKQSRFALLSLKSSQMNNYFDLRVEECGHLDLSNTIVKDIIDIDSVELKTNIKGLDISGIRLLGRIFIDWKLNDVKKLIYAQNTGHLNRAEQFRVLKENYNLNGQYEYEDEAYIEFKRCESKFLLEKSKQENIFKRIWENVNYVFRYIVFDKVGLYATNPIRVLFSMTVIYLIFSLIYIVIPLLFHDSAIISSLFEAGDIRDLNLVEKAFYHSAITFLTIGYGDYYPAGAMRWLSGVEGFIGLFLMSYFTVAFVRKILR
ncbi:MAG: two pore domain potassium channel family protein [Bacteroidales bacterium]|nr:two pore domain potassium channel family protein [Bacteroidales bacterium]MBN2757999.1 two pore domain potassium channel family protein [Bacteroidales bacterium]